MMGVQMAALVPGLSRGKDNRLDKLAFLEQIDRPIYRGDADGFCLCVLFPLQYLERALMDLRNGQGAIRSPDELENDIPLTRLTLTQSMLDGVGIFILEARLYHSIKVMKNQYRSRSIDSFRGRSDLPFTGLHAFSAVKEDAGSGLQRVQYSNAPNIKISFPVTRPTMNPTSSSEIPRLTEVALLFLKLGTTAFGGPAAHIAMMEEEVVRRRQWISHEEFLDLLGASNLIPGPNSTELAIHIGYRRAGWTGLLVAGGCFILPATLIVAAIAWAYVRFGRLPEAGGLLYGIKPVIIAVVLQALWNLGRSAVKTKLLAAFGAIGLIGGFFGVHELVVLFGIGLLAVLGQSKRLSPASRSAGGAAFLISAPASTLVHAAGIAGAVSAVPFSMGALFLFFLKVGSVLFGSGYVLLAFLRAQLVERWHWLTENQLLDAIAVGQFTPGPVFTTATFIGYLLDGPLGAVVATVGIFLPAFFFVAISGPLVPRLRASPKAKAFLDGVNVASLALMAVVTWHLGKAALVDWITIGIAIASAILLIRLKVNSAWVVLGGALIGVCVFPFLK